ncbi:hypothetical protein Tco_0459698 [Tanacetum coccineum]
MHVIEQPLLLLLRLALNLNIVAQMTALYDLITEIACPIVGELKSMFEKQAGMKGYCGATGTAWVNANSQQANKKSLKMQKARIMVMAKERIKGICPVYLAELQKKRKQVGSASSSEELRIEKEAKQRALTCNLGNGAVIGRAPSQSTTLQMSATETEYLAASESARKALFGLEIYLRALSIVQRK